MRIVFLKIFLLFSTSILAENIIIRGHFKGEVPFEKVILKKYFHSIQNYQSVSIKDKKMEMVLPDSIASGVYRLFLDRTDSDIYFDIIINKLDTIIAFEYDANSKNSPVSITTSNENIAYYNFLNAEEALFQKIAVQQIFLQNYPDTNEMIYIKMQEEYRKTMERYKNLRNSFIDNTLERYFWANQLVKHATFLLTEDSSNAKKTVAYLKYSDYWKAIDTSNDRLLYTPLFFDKILEFLKRIQENSANSFPLEAQKDMTIAMDTIIDSFSENDVMKTFAINYLLTGFKEIGAEEYVKYIDLRYKNSIAGWLKGTDSIAFQKRLETYEKIKQGSKVPNIVWNTTSGSVNDLYGIPTPKILLVFWSSECDHCQTIMPKLDEIAKNNTNVTVIGIGVEWNKNSYMEAIKKYKNIWHYSEFKGWEGNTIMEYGIQSTPSFYVLDKEKKLLQRSDTLDAMVNFLP